jgi:hypothetical protein
VFRQTSFVGWQHWDETLKLKQMPLLAIRQKKFASALVQTNINKE